MQSLIWPLLLLGQVSGVTPFGIDHDKSTPLTKVTATLMTATKTEAKCEFSFETASKASAQTATPPPAPVVAVAASSPAVANAQSIEALRGVCVEQINGHDYWLFRVCIGVEVTQYHDQEKYNLGKFVPWVGDPPSEGRQQQFKNGNPCDAKPREATVTYSCGDLPGIVRVAEPNTCAYQIDVVHPTLCANANFPRLNSAKIQRAPEPPKADSTVENWFLEMTQDTQGKVGCAVHNTGSGPQVIFTKFSMQLSKAGTPVNVAEVKARRPSRMALHPSEYTASQTIVSHTDKFAGTLEFVSLWSAAPL